MNLLIKGAETEHKINLLMDLADVRSSKKRDALVDYFCQGWTQSNAARLNKISQSTLAAAAKKLQKKYHQACLVADSK